MFHFNPEQIQIHYIITHTHTHTLQIPVFQGCAGPLVGANNLCTDHFGSDGLGDVLEDRDPRWKEKIQKENAVNAMIRLVTEHQNQVREQSAGCCPAWGY